MERGKPKGKERRGGDDDARGTIGKEERKGDKGQGGEREKGEEPCAKPAHDVHTFTSMQVCPHLCRCVTHRTSEAY